MSTTKKYRTKTQAPFLYSKNFGINESKVMHMLNLPQTSNAITIQQMSNKKRWLLSFGLNNYSGMYLPISTYNKIYKRWHLQINFYKASRIKNKLPRNGQRTKTNAKTVKKY